MKVFRTSIGAKVGLATAAPFLLIILMGTVRLYEGIAADSEVDQRIHAETVLQHIVSRIRFDMELEDDARIKAALESIGEDSEDLLAVRVFAADHTLLAIWTASNQERQSDEQPDTRVLTQRVRRKGEYLGRVELELSMDRWTRRIQHHREELAYLICMLVGLLACTSIGIGWWLSRRFSNLSSTLKGITHGDLSVRAPQGPDEIGILGATLNRMAETIHMQQLDLICARDEAVKQAELAKEANIAKSHFLANMSHEIRTPMTAILGFSEELLSNVRKIDNIDALKTIILNGNYLLGLINNILDLSKVEAGKMVVENVPCSPPKIVAEILSLMSVRANVHDLTMDTRYASPIPETIQSDPTRLRQILINMMGNAIKFTEHGSVHMEVSLDRENSLIRFDFIDTGIGMTEEQVGKLFKPFVQGDSSTTRKFGGTGLGLALSGRLAELLGGSITVVDSKPGQGTHMRVAVATGPLAGVRMLTDPRTATAVEPHEAEPSASDPPLEGCRILYAEDGPDNQRLVSIILKKAGAEVTIQENGKLAVDDALDALEKGAPYDVILMDMQMPVMGGYEAARLLRDKGFDAPIIALTANAMSEDRQKCLDAGCDDFATKPINRKKLIETIRNKMG